MGPAWLRHGWLVGRTAARRQHRRAREKPLLRVLQWLPMLLAGLALVGKNPLPVVGDLWAAPGAYVYGQQFADGAVAATVATVRGTAGVLFLLLVYGGVLNQINEGETHHRDGLLTTVSPRAVALGGVIETTVNVGVRLLPAVAAAAVAFGVGAGPLAAVTLFLAGVGVVATGPAVGYVGALAIQTAFARSPAVRENKLLFGTPLALGYFALFVRFRQSSAFLGATPIGWYGDLGLVGTAPTVGAGQAVGAAVGTVLVVGAAVEAAATLGRRTWFADPPVDAGTDEDDDTGPSLAARAETAVARVASRPTAAVARATWRRLAREPKALLFVALPIVLTAGVGEQLAQRRPAALPMVIALYGSAAVGMGVTLNPLGAAGAALPATLAAPRGRRHLLRGYAVAMGLPGTVAVVAVTVAGGVATPGVSLAATAGTAVLAAVFAVTATFASLGIGTALPRFEGLDPSDTSTIAVPRIQAMSLLLFVAVIVGVPALLGFVFTDALRPVVGGSATVATAVGVGLSLALAATASALGYRRAVQRVEEFEVDG